MARSSNRERSPARVHEDSAGAAERIAAARVSRSLVERRGSPEPRMMISGSIGEHAGPENVSRPELVQRAHRREEFLVGRGRERQFAVQVVERFSLRQGNDLDGGIRRGEERIREHVVERALERGVGGCARKARGELARRPLRRNSRSAAGGDEDGKRREEFLHSLSLRELR
jgi:hypothetical protein